MTAVHDTSLLAYLGQTVRFTDMTLCALLPLGTTANNSTPLQGRVVGVVIAIEGATEPSLLVDLPGAEPDFFAVSDMAGLVVVPATV
ncbi:hypothetical protein [Halopseudomonas aestusnigri]|uniref:hypothetical protein n=1 Tax=Halopseudomonas aestusnigri TaxID=857252 RepID=UPI0030020191